MNFSKSEIRRIKMALYHEAIKWEDHPIPSAAFNKLYDRFVKELEDMKSIEEKEDSNVN
jgi:hypothetical protein